ncbi:MAG: HIT domain-containing protein [Candidatus Cloacimonetes bacterium]|nr:HIT domain-containing protein [Candidatus Cloacimonadota bacterium]
MDERSYLYSPWRMDYILGEKQSGCVFCHARDSANDEENLVLYRAEHSYIILNRYPYNNGHLLIVPNAHQMCINDLAPEAFSEMNALVRTLERVLKEVYHCDGINLGMNLGSAAGAGIEAHLHMHMVPRWRGDSNFMGVVAGERVIPEAFETTYKKLKDELLRQL